jgi:septum site-determining protein MinC
MTSGSPSAQSAQPAAELKSGTFILPTLLMSGLDTETIDGLLCERVAKAPNFFRNTPVVLDLTNAHKTKPQSDLAIAVGAIRGYGLVPIGVRGGTDELRDQARLMELAVFPQSRKGNEASAQNRITNQKPTSKPKVATTTIIETPVRSGQRIYARGGDLVLLAPVSSGAEVVADGHVHAYAPIRGRVLAGVLGDESACIFCKDLSAELVSIAGRYKVSEDLDPRYMGRLVAVSLTGDSLIFKKL